MVFPPRSQPLFFLPSASAALIDQASELRELPVKVVRAELREWRYIDQSVALTKVQCLKSDELRQSRHVDQLFAA